MYIKIKKCGTAGKNPDTKSFSSHDMTNPLSIQIKIKKSTIFVVSQSFFITHLRFYAWFGLFLQMSSDLCPHLEDFGCSIESLCS